MISIHIKYIGLKHPKEGVIEEIAALSESKTYKLTESPKMADMILFVKLSGYGPFVDILLDPLYRSFKKKCYVFFSGDQPLYFLPGLYACLEKKWSNNNWTRAMHYLHGPDNLYMTRDRIHSTPKYLFSFIGNTNTHSCRQEILKLRGGRGYIVDTRNEIKRMGILQSKEEKEKENARYRIKYADSLYKSKFILCPRGFGTSSFRIFEAMRCGRIPVIISDEWVEPYGSEWSKFSFRIAESEISKIPDFLAQNEHRFADMSSYARKAWEQGYSKKAAFNQLMNELANLNEHAERPRPKYIFINLIRSLKINFIKGFVKEKIMKRL